jgi:hypothetical protein
MIPSLLGLKTRTSVVNGYRKLNFEQWSNKENTLFFISSQKKLFEIHFFSCISVFENKDFRTSGLPDFRKPHCGIRTEVRSSRLYAITIVTNFCSYSICGSPKSKNHITSEYACKIKILHPTGNVQNIELFGIFFLTSY